MSPLQKDLFGTNQISLTQLPQPRWLDEELTRKAEEKRRRKAARKNR